MVGLTAEVGVCSRIQLSAVGCSNRPSRKPKAGAIIAEFIRLETDAEGTLNSIPADQ